MYILLKCYHIRRLKYVFWYKKNNCEVWGRYDNFWWCLSAIIYIVVFVSKKLTPVWITRLPCLDTGNHESVGITHIHTHTPNRVFSLQILNYQNKNLSVFFRLLNTSTYVANCVNVTTKFIIALLNYRFFKNYCFSI